MNATEKTHRFMSLMKDATKFLELSNSSNGASLYTVHSMTETIREIRNLELGDMLILLSQLRCEVSESNYKRVCDMMMQFVSDYIEAYNLHVDRLTEDYSPFHLIEMAKNEAILKYKRDREMLEDALNTSKEDNDTESIQILNDRLQDLTNKENEYADNITSKLESGEPRSILYFADRMMSAISGNEESDDSLQSTQSDIIQESPAAYGTQGNDEKKKKAGRPSKERNITDLREVFTSKEGYRALCEFIDHKGTLGCGECKNLFFALQRCRILVPSVSNLGLFGELIVGEFHHALSFDTGRSIYNGEINDDMIKEAEHFIKVHINPSTTDDSDMRKMN